MLSQKDAVHKAVTAHKQPDGSFDRKLVVDDLCKMFRAGEFEHSDPEKVREDKALRTYCGGMVSNWLRKDERLGGTEQAASKTGGRKKAKPADDEMKRLMMAKVVLTKEGQSTQDIDVLIQQRAQQIAAEQASVVQDTVNDAVALCEMVENQQP